MVGLDSECSRGLGVTEAGVPERQYGPVASAHAPERRANEALFLAAQRRVQRIERCCRGEQRSFQRGILALSLHAPAILSQHVHGGMEGGAMQPNARERCIGIVATRKLQERVLRNVLGQMRVEKKTARDGHATGVLPKEEPVESVVHVLERWPFNV